MNNNHEITLHSFFVFNPSLIRNEADEGKKILFYYPYDTDVDSQLKSVGLCEALIKFSSSFESSDPCELCCTQKTKQFMQQVEPNYWMVLTLKTPGENTQIIADNIYKNVLNFIYKTFYLFYGTFENIETTDLLRIKLCDFFVKYLEKHNIGNSSLLDIFHGINFLPLSKEPFLHIISFLNKLELAFPLIKHSVLLYTNQLVWSSIQPDDMQILYQYLINTVTPNAFSVTGNFLTEEGVMDIKYPNKIPVVHLTNGNTRQCFQVIIYHIMNTTLSVFIDEKNKFDDFKNLSAYLQLRMPPLISEVSEFIVRSTTPQLDAIPRFLYFNNINKAIKNTLSDKNEKSMPPEAFHLITDINNRCCDNGEIIIKTVSGLWVAGKFSTGREFYIVSQKKSSLIEIGTEIKKICDSQLKGIFFLD